MTKLSGACQRLTRMMASPGSDGSGSPGAASPGALCGALPEAAKRAINGVHGHSLGIAALLGASTRSAPAIPQTASPCQPDRRV